MSVAIVSYSDSRIQHRVVLDRESTSIGRSLEQDIVLSDVLVSRQHAVITREGNAWILLDQNSTHGTYLNSVRIHQANLKPGDVVQIGSLKGKKLTFLI